GAASSSTGASTYYDPARARSDRAGERGGVECSQSRVFLVMRKEPLSRNSPHCFQREPSITSRSHLGGNRKRVWLRDQTLLSECKRNVSMHFYVRAMPSCASCGLLENVVSIS